MEAKKSLGQNFLTSVSARIAIAKEGGLDKNDLVLEIGPGKGFLTEEILKTGVKVIAIEKDTRLISYLKEKFLRQIKTGQLKLLDCDILNFEFENYDLKPKTYKLIANIPYYLTGAIFEKFLSADNQPKQMVVLIQKEVAERIVSKKESILSLSVKAYGEPKIVYRVKRGSFNPIPNVDSAVLSIKNIGRTNFKNKKHENNFFKIIKLGFSHKRKFLVSNLSALFSKKELANAFTKNKLSTKIRAEDVKLDTWLTLSTLL